jgi:uncharacterized repeat protein (TIGR01451 family)
MKKICYLVIGLWSALVLGQANNQIANMYACGDNNVGTFDLNQATNQALNGYNPSDFQVNFFLSLGELNANSNSISNVSNYVNVSNPQTLYMKITNTITNEIFVKNFDIEVANNPAIISFTETLCDFDLNVNESTYYNLAEYNNFFSQNGNYTVTYYDSLENASNATNPLNQSEPYTVFGYGNHTLYVRVQKANIDCFSISTYTIFLTDCSQSGSPTSLFGCLPSECFNLTINTSNILNTLNPSNYEVSYYTSENDAINNSNPIANTTSFCVSTNQTIFARLTNLQTNNFEVFSFELLLSDCTENNSPSNFSTTFCIDQGGTICDDLTNYNAIVIGTLNPDSYTISYHLSQLDADSNTNPIVTFCQGEGYHIIYSRIQNSTNPTLYFSTLNFIQIKTYSLIPDAAYLYTCDNDDDGLVYFNLTDSEQQIGVSNLTYYLNESDSLNQVNPISTTSNFAIDALSYAIIYGRVNQPGDCDYIFGIILNSLTDCINPFKCVEANSLCGALGVPFLNNQYSNYDEPNTDYGCLASHPNPTWFYMQANQNGSINLKVEQNTDINFAGQLLDVDYIVYGPFSDPIAGCSTLTADKIVNCSYSAQSTEYPVIQNSVAGQYYLIMVTNFSNLQGYIRITDINQEQGALDCSGIRLHAFIDSNNNAIKDSGEQNFPFGQFHVEKNNSGTVHHISSDNGSYTFYDTNQTNSYDFSYSIYSNLSNYYTVSPSSYTDSNVNQSLGIQDYFFPITSTQNYTDVAVTLISTDAPRPGFEHSLVIVYTNLSNQTIPSGTLSFSHDSLVDLIMVSQSGTSPITNGFSYNYTNLLPFETRYIYVVLNVPTTIAAGQIIVNNASITPTEGDVNAGDNTFSLTETVVNSFDPNDKKESHGDKILFSSFGTNDYLYYTIRFENTGTASAVNIKITDDLDQKLNPSTLQVISASSNYICDIASSLVNFEFRNILLPVSVPNTQIGHGYITFRIKPYPNYAIGDIIPNDASIYFDFNTPIATNTCTTEFVETLGNPNFAFSNLNYHPNPVKNSLSISNNHLIDSIEILSVLGQQMLSQKVNSLQTDIDLSELSSGIYFIKVISEGQEKTIKIMKE